MSNRSIFSTVLLVVLALQAGSASAGTYFPDGYFGNSPHGQSVFDLGDVNGSEAWALRVFERPGGAGYYILARHGHGNGTWDAVVLAIDAEGKNPHKYLIPTPMFRLDDATLDSGNGKFYFVGGAKRSGHPDSDFAITCLDITIGSSGGPCTGFGAAGTVLTSFDLGGNNDDVARRVVSRPGTGIIVSGWAKDGASRYVFAVSAYYRDSGAALGRFGTNGKFTHDVYQTGNADLDVNVYDMVLSNDTAADTTIYIAGNYSRVAPHKEYTGLIWALNGWNGTLAPFGTFGYKQVKVVAGNCSINCAEAVSALSIRHDQSIAFAGWAVDSNQNTVKTVGGVTKTGEFDPSLCNGTGNCQIGWTWSGQGSGNSFVPHDVRERPMTREIMVLNSIYYAIRPDLRNQSGYHESNRKAVGGTGYLTSYGWANIGYLEYNSYPAHTIMSGKYMIEVGTMAYAESPRDYRIAIVRYRDNDLIFFDQFGGSNSD